MVGKTSWTVVNEVPSGIPGEPEYVIVIVAAEDAQAAASQAYNDLRDRGIRPASQFEATPTEHACIECGFRPDDPTTHSQTTGACFMV